MRLKELTSATEIDTKKELKVKIEKAEKNNILHDKTIQDLENEIAQKEEQKKELQGKEKQEMSSANERKERIKNLRLQIKNVDEELEAERKREQEEKEEAYNNIIAALQRKWD